MNFVAYERKPVNFGGGKCEALEGNSYACQEPSSVDTMVKTSTSTFDTVDSTFDTTDDDVSSVGSEAPTLGTKKTTATDYTLRSLGNKKIAVPTSCSSSIGDMSSVGSKAPTVASKKSVAEASMNDRHVDIKFSTMQNNAREQQRYESDDFVMTGHVFDTDDDDHHDDHDVSSVGSEAPTFSTKITTATDYTARSLNGKQIDATATNKEFNDISSVGSEAPTLATKRTTATADWTIRSLKEKIRDTTVSVLDISNAGSETPSIASEESEKFEDAIDTEVTRMMAMHAVDDDAVQPGRYVGIAKEIDDISTVGSGAPTVATKITIATNQTLKSLCEKQIDTAAMMHDMSSVGTAPTLGSKRTTDTSLYGMYINERESSKKRTTFSKIGITGKEPPEAEEENITVTGQFIGTASTADELSTVGSEAPTLATKRTTATDYTMKSITKKNIDLTAAVDDMSSVGSEAPTVKSSKIGISGKERPEVEDENVTVTGQFIDTASTADELSTVGSEAPTLATNRTTATDYTIKSITKKEIDLTAVADDMSSVGSEAPTLASNKRTSSVPIRGNKDVDGSETSPCLSGMCIETSEDTDLVSCLASLAPTLATKKSFRLSSTGTVLDEKYVDVTGEELDISTVGSITWATKKSNKSASSSSRRNEKPIVSAMRTKDSEVASILKITKEKPILQKNISYASRRSPSQKKCAANCDDEGDEAGSEHHTNSEMDLLGGLLGRECLTSAMDDLVGSFIRKGACAGFVIWVCLLGVIYFVAPSSSYQYLTGYESISHFTTLVLLGGANYSRLAPYLVCDRSTAFLKSGVMAGNFTVQMVAISSITIMLLFPTPVLIDPIVGIRCHLVRWAEWTALAFLMTFLTESVDLPLEGTRNTRTAWFHGTVMALSTVAGMIFPFCKTVKMWLVVFAISWVLFCSLFVRLYQKSRRLQTMSTGHTTMEKEEYQRAKYSLRLISICTFLWTGLAVFFSLGCWVNKNAATGSFWMTEEWLVLTLQDFFEMLSKIGYLTVLLEAHEEMFDDVSKTAQRLEELRRYMSAVWDASSDAVVICSNHEHLVNAAVSPAFYNFENAFTGKCRSNDVSPKTLVMEVDPYDGAFRTFEIDLLKQISRFEVNSILQSFRNKTRVVTPLTQKNYSVLSDLVCDASTCCIPTGQQHNLLMANFYALDKDKNECEVPCEVKVSKLPGKATLLVVRDVSSRVRYAELEKRLTSYARERKKDNDVSRSLRYAVKDDLTFAMSLVDTMKKKTKARAKKQEGGSPKSSFVNDNETADKFAMLESRLKSIWSKVVDEGLSKDIITREYKPKRERTDVVKILSSSISLEDASRFTLEQEIDPFPPLSLDPELLHVIYQNAISNACRFGKRNGIVRTIIRYDEDCSEFLMKIMNEVGEGHDQLLKLSDDDLNKQVFSSGGTLSENSGGGKGGYIMRLCAEAMGGNCHIKCKPHHTVFGFRCPASAFEDVGSYSGRAKETTAH